MIARRGASELRFALCAESTAGAKRILMLCVIREAERKDTQEEPASSSRLPVSRPRFCGTGFRAVKSCAVLGLRWGREGSEKSVTSTESGKFCEFGEG